MTSLDVDTAETYWLAITHLEAREAMLSMSIADYPHMKKEARKRFASQIKSQIKDLDEEKKQVSLDDIEMKLRALLG